MDLHWGDLNHSFTELLEKYTEIIEEQLKQGDFNRSPQHMILWKNYQFLSFLYQPEDFPRFYNMLSPYLTGMRRVRDGFENRFAKS